jgi:hypothetical protein
MFRKTQAIEPGRAHVRPSFPALRVKTSFTCEGQLFREGTLADPQSDVVQRILAGYPQYFQLER